MLNKLSLKVKDSLAARGHTTVKKEQSFQLIKYPNKANKGPGASEAGVSYPPCLAWAGLDTDPPPWLQLRLCEVSHQGAQQCDPLPSL